MNHMSFISSTLLVVVICFIGVLCDAKTNTNQRRILQTTTPAPTPASLRDELLYDPGSFCKPQNILDANPTYTTTAIQCGNYCNPTTDKWYFTGFMLLGENGTICRCLVDSSIINTELQLTPDSTPPQGGEDWEAYIGYTERSEVDTQTSTFFALNVRVDDPFDYFDVYCFRQTEDGIEVNEEDEIATGSKDDGNNVVGTADEEDEDCIEQSPIFGGSKSSKRRSKSGKQYWSIKMSLNVDTMMDQFNMKPKSSKRHCKSSKSSKVQGKTDKHVYGKSYKENDGASGHTFSNALQRDSLSNNGGNRRLQDTTIVTLSASIIVACWIMIM